MQWTHSILEEENFMNEWKASIRALDLQYEVDPMCGTHSGRPTPCKTRRKSTQPERHPSFAQTVELYVGLEPETVFQQWPCQTGQAVLSTPIFQPFPQPEADEVSWLAAPVRREDRFQHAQRETDGRIMENEDIAINPHEDEGSDGQSSSPEDNSDVSEAAEGEGHPDWHTTVLFALDFKEVSLRLNWNDYEGFHHKVATKSGISSNLLYDTHHVRHQPEDLSRANAEAIIAHRHGDLTPGSALRLILIDVEFHHACPTNQPEIVRKVYKLPPHIGRVTLLHSLGLGHFCREVGHQCIIWHNHDMLRIRSAALINLQDGDFLRIAIPPVSEEVCQLSTRTVATASHQGITVEDLQLQQALVQVGWRDTAVSMPLVPLVPDFEIHEETTLLQRTWTPELDSRPPFLDFSAEDFAQRYKSSHLCEPPTFERSSDSHPPQQERDRLIELQTEATRHLHRHWRMQGAARNVNEENIMTIYTWFLSFPNVMKCERHREVHLRHDFWNWQAQIAQRWNDILEENMPFELHIVQPTPIGRAFTEEGPRHVILLQRSAAEHRAAVLTVLNNLPSTGSTLEQVAIFAPALASRTDLIQHFQLSGLCGEHQQEVNCLFWHGDREFLNDHQSPMRHGASLLLILNSRRPNTDNLWNAVEEEEDGLNFMQTSSAAGPHFRMNPDAPAFQPQGIPLHCFSETIQDIQEAWNRKTFSWEGEEKFVSFEVWMVDHGRYQLHCEHPRRVRLHEQIEQWEDIIKQAWADRIHPGEPYEFHLVQPEPPDLDQNTAGHIILIQNPQEVLITNLITVYDYDRGIGGPAMQVAGTTHEHIRMEHIVEGIGKAQQCLSNAATHHCEVWYAHQLMTRETPLPGRSGTGILVHLRTLQRRGPVLIQLAVSLVNTRERLTQGQVAHTPGPRSTVQHSMTEVSSTMAEKETAFATELITLDPNMHIPTYLELPQQPTSEVVQEELRHWGHSVHAWNCHPHNKFLCIPKIDMETEEAQSQQKHYLFCHADPHDVSGCFAHSDQPDLKEERLMEILCSLGYSRAVITERVPLHASWEKIGFSHQEPMIEFKRETSRQRSPWPQFQPCVEDRTAPMIDLQGIGTLSSDCALLTDFTVSDLQQFFASANDCLCHQFELKDLPEYVQTALEVDEPPNMDLTTYDRLLIYTDGSSRPEGRRMPPLQADEAGLQDTWAFLVLGERIDAMNATSKVFPLGWTAQPVSYQLEVAAFTGTQGIGSDQAERAAITFAGLWRLAQNVQVQTVICTDSTTAGGQAFGLLGVAEADPSYRLMRGVYQALQMALSWQGVQLHHTRSHAGDPYNEFVDQAAKLEAGQSFNHRRQQLDLQKWGKPMEYFWTLFGHAAGMPRWQNGGFAVPAPALPISECPMQTPEATKYSVYREVQCGLCLATANVQSLYKGPDGHGGKLHFLQEQMKYFKINCMAIQEARTEAGTRSTNGVLCYASGHQQGQLGVEIWFNLNLPIGWHQKRKGHQEHRLTKSDFCIVHHDPRRLLLRCDHPLLDCWFFTAHAPQSGRAWQERCEWWHETQVLLHQHCDEAPMIWLIDANAAPGNPDGTTVHQEGFSTSSSTPLFREALHERDMCLPATTACHIGDNATWTAPDGMSKHCIDHIAVPQGWLDRCTISQILPEFDLAQRHDDHHVVVLQLQWRGSTAIQTKRNRTAHMHHIDFKHDKLKEELKAFSPAAWHVDVEHQTRAMIEHIHQAMGATPQQLAPKAKKPYVTADVWELRIQKLRCRHQLKHLRRQLAKESMFACFINWKLRQESRTMRSPTLAMAPRYDAYR